MQLEAEGTFSAKVMPSPRYVGKNDKGSWSFELPLIVTGGEFDGNTITAYFSINDTIRQGGKFRGRTNREANEEAMRKAFDWDGDYYALAEGRGFDGKPCRIKVEKENYNGEYRYRVAYVWPVGGLSALAPTELDQLMGVRRRPTTNQPPPRANHNPDPPDSGSKDDLPF